MTTAQERLRALRRAQVAIPTRPVVGDEILRRAHRRLDRRVAGRTVAVVGAAAVLTTLGVAVRAGVNRPIPSPPPALPSISVADVTVAEGDAETSEATFQLTLSAGTARTVAVIYETQGIGEGAGATATEGVSETAGTDYLARGRRVVFPAGETTTTVSVPVVGDTADEEDETFLVILEKPRNATIEDGRAVGAITDDDDDDDEAPPPPALRRRSRSRCRRGPLGRLPLSTRPRGLAGATATEGVSETAG